MGENQSLYSKQRLAYEAAKAKNSDLYLLQKDGSKIQNVDLASSTEKVLEILNYNTGKVLEHIETLKEHAESINNTNDLISDNTRHKVNWINAIEYGFKNDGTDNSSTMNKFILNDNDKILYFPSGIYCFTKEIAFTSKMYLSLDANAELKLISACDNFISFNTNYLSNGYSIGCFIKGGKINGNHMCNNLLNLSMYRMFHLDTQLFNFNVNGLTTLYSGTSGGELISKNLLIQNSQAKIGSVAINDNGNDNRFNTVIVQDVETAVKTGASQFGTIHAWISLQDLIPTSTFCILTGNGVSFNNIVIDTIRYGFVLQGNNPYSVNVANLAVTFNSNVWTAAYASSSAVLFGGNANSRYNIVNCYIDNNITGLILNVAPVSLMPNSNFINMTYDGSSGTYVNKQNRNASTDLAEGTITSSGDLNNYTTSGVYSVQNSLPANFPSGAYGYGTLIVLASQYMITQIYTEFQNTTSYRSVWIRTGVPGNFSNAWLQLTYSKGGTLGSTMDLNNVKTGGTFSINGSSPTNFPSGANNIGILTVDVSQYLIRQVYTEYASPHYIYIRTGDGTNWTTWSKLSPA
jgi:hypothetical protein